MQKIQDSVRNNRFIIDKCVIEFRKSLRFVLDLSWFFQVFVVYNVGILSYVNLFENKKLVFVKVGNLFSFY